MDAEKSWCNRVTFLREFQTGKDSKIRLIWPWLKQKLLSAPFQTGISVNWGPGPCTTKHKGRSTAPTPCVQRVARRGHEGSKFSGWIREMKIPFHRPGFRKKPWFLSGSFDSSQPFLGNFHQQKNPSLYPDATKNGRQKTSQNQTVELPNSWSGLLQCCGLAPHLCFTNWTLEFEKTTPKTTWWFWKKSMLKHLSQIG